MQFPTPELQEYARRILAVDDTAIPWDAPDWFSTETRDFVVDTARVVRMHVMHDNHYDQEIELRRLTSDVVKRRALRGLVAYPDHAHLLDVPIEAYQLLLASKAAPAALFVGIVSRPSWKK